jgi:hypothetical protein
MDRLALWMGRGMPRPYTPIRSASLVLGPLEGNQKEEYRRAPKQAEITLAGPSRGSRSHAYADCYVGAIVLAVGNVGVRSDFHLALDGGVLVNCE